MSILGKATGSLVGRVERGGEAERVGCVLRVLFSVWHHLLIESGRQAKTTCLLIFFLPVENLFKLEDPE